MLAKFVVDFVGKIAGVNKWLVAYPLDRMGEIGTSVNLAAERMTEIADLLGEQTAASTQIAENITQIASRTATYSRLALPACWYWTAPLKLSFVVIVKGPVGAVRRTRFFALLAVW